VKVHEDIRLQEAEKALADLIEVYQRFNILMTKELS